MRRLSLPLAMVFVMLLGLALIGGLPLAAQEGTPAADTAGEDELPASVTSEFIGGGSVTDLPPPPAFMALVRLTLAPGAVLPSDEDDRAGALLVVESGTVTLDIQGAAPTTSKLGPGESFYVAPFLDAVLRNEGDEPVVMLLLAIIAPEEETAAATPAP